MAESEGTDTMTNGGANSIQATVIAITLDLIQDWGLDLSDNIEGATSFVKELEFASVDIIQLCVAIEQHYGRKLGFQDLLMVDGSYVSDLTVGQISQYIQSKLSAAQGN